MTIDLITIILSVGIVAVGLLSVCQNPFFRRKFLKRQSGNGNSQLPPVSILITTNDNAREIEEKLPLYLAQDYEADYQVIIVSCEGDGDTDDVMKRYASERRLYHTFIPKSSRYVSRKKLAITMGVKAAKYEWVLLTDIECRPAGKDWLHTMAQESLDDKNMVLGVSKYAAGTSVWKRFEHAHTLLYVLRKAVFGTAFRTNCPNLMFRKSEFIKQNGFSGNLDLVRGEYDFLVNKYARRGSVATVTNPEGWVIEDEPTRKRWREKHVYYLANRHSLKRGLSWRLLFNADQWALHLPLILCLTLIAISAIIKNWILMGSAIVPLLLMIILRTIMARKAMRDLGEQLPAWRLYLLQTGIIWHNLVNLLRYHKADKMDFTSHKI